MTWTLIYLSIATWNMNGWDMTTRTPDSVSLSVQTYPTRDAAIAALIARGAEAANASQYNGISAIPAILGPYATSRWDGTALLVSPTGTVEHLKPKMGTRTVRKEVDVLEETGWTVEVIP